MTIQDWGAIGELVGAFAVVASLMYFAVQVRHARVAVTDESRHNRVAGVRDTLTLLIQDAQLRHAFVKTAGPGYDAMLKAVSDSCDVSIDEACLLAFWNSNFVWTHWAQFRSLKTAADTRELENIVAMWYTTPIMTVLIEDPIFRSSFDPEFIQWVDETLEKSGSRIPTTLD
jgi:hypothetical protein